MKKLFFLLLLPALMGCGDKKDFQVALASFRDGGETVYVSDPGVTVTVTWKSFRPSKGRATLFDGYNNTVLSCDVPTQWDDPANDNVAVVQYQFAPQDKPGNWRLEMTFGEEEIVHHVFMVMPPYADPGVHKRLACQTTNGRIALHNFYQLSELERASVLSNNRVGDVGYLIYQIKMRSALCFSGGENWDDWENWFEEVSGQRVRQPHPFVHERIKAVMPVYEEEFHFLNPEFVKWFAETMIPDPNESPVNGFVYQEIYDKIARHDARRLALTYLYYKSLPDSGLDAQVQYAEMAARYYVNEEEDRVMERHDRISIYDHINERYDAASAEWVASKYGTEVIGGGPYYLSDVDMAFWLRRSIDGSADELWVAFCDVLKKYDEHWYFQMIEPNWVP